MTPHKSSISLSVVIPFFNEEAAAFQIVDELCQEMTHLENGWEAILVNDGSKDGTAAELERARARWPQCRVLHLAQNRGQGGALLHGIQAATAPIIGMMDGDGQNVPGDLHDLLPLLLQADMVVGVRVDRHDSKLRHIMSRIANRVRGTLLRDGVSDAGCALKVFRREVVESFLPVHMLNPFMPAFAVSGGFRVIERAVRHRERQGGESKYGFRVMLWRPMFDMLALAWVLRRRIPVNAKFHESIEPRMDANGRE
ncbi:MAG TPA: glycosyltransferase family 2 protein [Opitutaceae bacterium]|nr:glycosyltransferase family 2 protein [Opitutaceae bacterium]